MNLIKEVSLGEESYAIVYQEEITGQYALYEIPLYGGDERFCDFYNTLEECEAVYSRWT